MRLEGPKIKFRTFWIYKISQRHKSAAVRAGQEIAFGATIIE